MTRWPRAEGRGFKGRSNALLGNPFIDSAGIG
jgi:hypothetical protein